MMKVSVRQAGKVSIVDMRGKLDLGATSALKDAVGRLLGEGRRQIVLNMLGIEWIDSTGLGELMACHLRAKRDKGEIKLVLSPKVREIIVMVKLQTVFDIHDEELKAVGSF